jgi:type I restriction enzyme S subunit
MSRLDELIAQLCHDGVEYEKLGTLSKVITKGTTPSSYLENGINFIKIESIDNSIIDLKKVAFISERTHNQDLRRSILQANDILFAIAGAIGKCAIVSDSLLPANTNQALAIIRLKDDVCRKFVFYYLQSSNMKMYIERNVKGSAQSNLNLQQIYDFKIPLPPLPVQEEIVRILDKFTILEAELEAELEAREKQYTYYCDDLLDFSLNKPRATSLTSRLQELIQTLCPDGVEYSKLGELSEIVRGVNYPKSAESTDEGGYKILRANNITLSFRNLNFDDVKRISRTAKVHNKQKLTKGDILICTASGSSEHIGKTAYIDSDMDFYFGGFMAVLRTKNLLNNRLLFHLLGSEKFTNYLKDTLNSTTINNLNSTILNNFPIPLLPVDVQEEIVNILDRFDMLVHSLQSGLPAEIAARHKQYEYYRDQLLTFQSKPPLQRGSESVANGGVE